MAWWRQSTSVNSVQGNWWKSRNVTTLQARDNIVSSKRLLPSTLPNSMRAGTNYKEVGWMKSLGPCRAKWTMINRSEPHTRHLDIDYSDYYVTQLAANITADSWVVQFYTIMSVILQRHPWTHRVYVHYLKNRFFTQHKEMCFGTHFS